ncbi:hypothetical protein TrST_g10981 [Triparma strigata]|uniref:Uncharacterized protein n=1 Tax=Triparma strigata TaxID=1606541 RepID=A0A9W7BYP4_9STRA|nr:hypothetical protein TrST_g10981 [Triparma strigata]
MFMLVCVLLLLLATIQYVTPLIPHGVLNYRTNHNRAGRAGRGSALNSFFRPFDGIEGLSNSATSDPVTDLQSVLTTSDTKTLTIFSTYASDFNNIEYAQRLTHYLPLLQKKGVETFNMIINGSPEQCELFRELVGLPAEVNIISDPEGTCGKKFGVNLGWRSDDDSLSPYFKLYMMLFGFGAWATLPSVIGGYIGNPFSGQPWIETAMKINIQKNRFPTNGLVLDSSSNEVVSNKFSELPIVGEWPRRPLELATLRLQNMIGISFQNWSELLPSNLNLLTQLGGCVILDSNGNEVYKFRDRGICDVCNFEKMLEDI